MFIAAAESEPTTSPDAVTDGDGEADMRRTSNRPRSFLATCGVRSLGLAGRGSIL